MNDQKPRRGSPCKPDNEKHLERIELRVTAEQKDVYLQAAELEGKTLSMWLRDIIDPLAKQIIKTKGPV